MLHSHKAVLTAFRSLLSRDLSSLLPKQIHGQKFKMRDTDDANGLCHWCEEIFSNCIVTPQVGRPIDQHHVLNQSPDELDQSARQGCPLCRLRRRAFSEEEFRLLDRQAPITYRFNCLQWVGREDMQLILQYSSESSTAMVSKTIRMISESSELEIGRKDV